MLPDGVMRIISELILHNHDGLFSILHLPLKNGVNRYGKLNPAFYRFAVSRRLCYPPSKSTLSPEMVRFTSHEMASSDRPQHEPDGCALIMGRDLLLLQYLKHLRHRLDYQSFKTMKKVIRAHFTCVLYAGSRVFISM